MIEKSFYAALMHNPTTDKFCQLICRNNGNRRLHTGSIVVDSKELHSPDEQRSAFAKYYEDLSIPKDHGYDTAYLELCSVRHHLIVQLCEESLSESEPFTTKEVREVALQLNNKKAADELLKNTLVALSLTTLLTFSMKFFSQKQFQTRSKLVSLLQC